MPIAIPENLLNNPDRKSAFQEIKEWMSQELQSADFQIEDAIASGSRAIDEALAGGYEPGKVTEIVEATPSRGAQSLIHSSIQSSRRNQQFLALVDPFNQFDPNSESVSNLESLLWVRCPKVTDAIKACDILIRDGNFPLLLLDLRSRASQPLPYVRPQSWYRLQRASEQSKIAFVALTSQSTVPCAHYRIQLTRSVSIELLDYPFSNSLENLECSILKRKSILTPQEQNQASVSIAGR